MQKPPNAMEVKRWKKSVNKIVLRNALQIKPSQQLTERSETLPAPPEHLNKLIGQPWTSENSRRVDLWLLYCQMEFEMVGGKY